MPVNIPPQTGNGDLDQYLYDVSQELNSFGATGADASEVSTDNQQRPTVSGIVLPYPFRYLDVAYATNANGANLSQTIRGLPAGSTTIYQGVRNQQTEVPDNNPASFTWRLINHNSSSDTLNAFYQVLGGRQIDWDFTDSADGPANFIIESSGDPIDLDDFAAQGEAGNTPIAYYSANSLESEPTTLPPSTEWVLAADRDPDTTYNWVIWGDTGTDGESSIFDLTATGMTGARVETTAAQAETGTITVRSDLNTGSGAVAMSEEIELEITPEGTGGSTGVNAPATVPIADWDAVGEEIVISGTVDNTAVASVDLLFAFNGVARRYEFALPRVGTTRADLMQALSESTFPIAQSTSTFSTVLEITAATYDSATMNYTVTFRQVSNPSGGFTVGSVFTSAFATVDDTPMAIVRSAQIPSQIRIQETALMVDETLTLEPNLTTQLAIEQDFRTKFNANTNLRMHFDEMAAVTADDHPTIVYTAVGLREDTALTVTEIDNSGSLGLMETVTVQGTDGTYIQGVVGFNYEGGITNVMLGQNQDANAIASTIATMLDGLSQYSATAMNNVVTFTRTTAGVLQSAFTRSIVTAGTPMLVASDFVLSVTAGTAPIFSGADGSIILNVDGIPRTLTLSNRSAEQMIDDIRGLINGTEGAPFRTSEVTPTRLRATASLLRAAPLTITNFTAGTVYDADTDTTTPATATLQRTVVRAGVNPAFLAQAVSQLRGDTGPASPFRLDIFRRSTTLPAEPTGGTQTTAPTGWSFTVPTGTDQVYTAFVIINPVSDTTTTDLGTRWSAPFIAGGTGPQGENGVGSQVRIIYNNNAQTLTPSLPTAANVVDNGWSTVPMTNSVWFAQQTNVTSADGMTVSTFGDWVGPNIIRGVDGTNPTVTDNGDGTYTVRDGDGNTVTINDGEAGSTQNLIFRRSTTTPATPAASAGVPNGWFDEVADVPAGDGEIYASFGMRSGTATVFTWQAPVRVTAVDGVNPVVSMITGGARITDGDGNTVDVMDGATGDDGDSTNIIFQRSVTQPTTPGPSAGVPVDWFDAVTDVPAGDGDIYLSTGFKPSGMTNFTWNTPSRIEAQDGITNAHLIIYQRVATGDPAPTSVTGGSYNLNTGTLTTPADWSTAIPTGSGEIYAAAAVVTSRETSGLVTPTWGTPELAFQSGGQGPRGDTGPVGQSSRIDIAYADDRTGTNGRYPSGTGSSYRAAIPLDSNDFIGQRVVTWTTTEPAPVAVAVEYAWTESRGAQGAQGPRSQIFGVQAETSGATDNLTNTQAEALFASSNLSSFATSIAGDVMFVESTSADIESTAYVAQGSGVWSRQTEYVPGNLLVAGTVSADRLMLDGVTLDTNAQGQLTVSQGGGITTIGGRLGANVDGTTVSINDEGEIFAPRTVPVPLSFTGGYTRLDGTTGSRVVVNSPPFSTSNTYLTLQGDHDVSPAFVRIDLQTVGGANGPGSAAEVTGLSLSDFFWRTNFGTPVGGTTTSSNCAVNAFLAYAALPNPVNNTRPASTTTFNSGGTAFFAAPATTPPTGTAFFQGSTTRLNISSVGGSRTLNSSTGSGQFPLVGTGRYLFIWPVIRVASNVTNQQLRAASLLDLIGNATATLTIHHTGASSGTTLRLRDHIVYQADNTGPQVWA